MRRIGEVVSRTPGRGQVGKHETSDGGTHHAVGQTVEPKINDAVLFDKVARVSKVRQHGFVGILRGRQQFAQFARSEHLQDRQNRRDHFAEVLLVVVAQRDETVDFRGLGAVGLIEFDEGINAIRERILLHLVERIVNHALPVLLTVHFEDILRKALRHHFFGTPLEIAAQIHE